MICTQNIKELNKHRYRYIMSKNGLIFYDKDIPITMRFDTKETNQILGKELDYSRYDEVCEVAHLEISNKCNLNCAYCYTGPKEEKELSTNDWKVIIKKLADAGIFQVTFGGGEPTLRKDLFKLAEYVSDYGMNLGMTTNGISLDKLDWKRLKKYFKQINVSWHQNLDTVERALWFLDKHDIPAGINYCYSKKMEWDNSMVRYLANNYNAELLYLVYKPVIKDINNQIAPKDVYAAAKKAADQKLRVAVDGPCVNKCMMKKKFIDVNSVGEVYPCSFVRNSIGNLLNQDFKDIWINRGKQEKCPYVEFMEECNV